MTAVSMLTKASVWGEEAACTVSRSKGKYIGLILTQELQAFEALDVAVSSPADSSCARYDFGPPDRRRRLCVPNSCMMLEADR